MTKRANRFEAAFEDYLLTRCLPYIATDQSKRPRRGSGPTVKNIDFIVTSPRKECALIDVKGKRHPAVSGKRRHYWENWIMGDDIDGLTFWESCFGRHFTALLVYVYEITDPARRCDFQDIHPFRGNEYGLVGVHVGVYSKNMKVRSARWNTRSVPVKVFQSIIRPVTAFL